MRAALVTLAALLALGGAFTTAVRAVTTPRAIPFAVSAGPKQAKVVFVDVGQGDGVVMRIGGKVIVSDAGEHKPEKLAAALQSVKAKRIDVVIASHPHDDHIENLLGLFAGWEVKAVVLSRSQHWAGTPTNRAVMAAIDAEGVTPTYVAAGDRFSWGGADWEILNPPADRYDGGESQAANASVAYLLRVNGVAFLFTGDVEKRVAKGIALRLDPLIDAPVDVFLATHHGSKHGSIQELLDVARPRWAVLSTGPNAHGHPAVEAIERLKAADAAIWCTHVNGTIDARVSARGRLTWRAHEQPAPWWSSEAERHTGACVERVA